MTNEFIEIQTKIINSIHRLPDKLSNPSGEKIRAEYAQIFEKSIIGHLDHEEFGYMALPFQASLLTDPIIFIVSGGHVILDHPVRDEQHIAMIPTHTVSLNRRMSLYENRYPRLIALPKKHHKIPLSWMMNQLRQLDFVGPFAKQESANGKT